MSSGFLPAALCDEWLIPPMAKIVGAEEDEVCLMNGLRKVFEILNSHWSTTSANGNQILENCKSVNLHLLLNSFYRPNGKRRKILIEVGYVALESF